MGIMNIRRVMDRIVQLQGDLAIEEPTSMRIAKAYKYVPPMRVAAPSTPCFMNTWTMVGETRRSVVREQMYIVHMQLLVADADQDRAADIASAFHEQLVNAFDKDVTLLATCTRQALRGADPTLVLLERAGRAYIGLNLYLDVWFTETQEFEP